MPKKFRAEERRDTSAFTPRDIPDGEKEARRPKRKVACLIGYSGLGYSGMQLNPPAKTIEGDLFDAFVKTGAISKDNSDDPKKVFGKISFTSLIEVFFIKSGKD